jgi:hypothetical protein
VKYRRENSIDRRLKMVLLRQFLKGIWEFAALRYTIPISLYSLSFSSAFSSKANSESPYFYANKILEM